MSDKFTYHGEEYEYFWHLYNLTMFNERAVEIAIATRWLNERVQWADGLEVGNVMGHYGAHRHLVFDLHEPAAWYQELARQPVVSVDILEHLKADSADFWEYEQFPWVLSISTIEHTEDPLRAIDVLQELVAPGGKLLVTFPTGVHDVLDQYIVEGAPGMDLSCTMVRTELLDGWEQTPEPVIREYGTWANAIAVCEWTAPA